MYTTYPSLESFRRLMASVSSDTRQEGFHVSLPRLQTSSRLTEEQPLLFSSSKLLKSHHGSSSLKTSARRTTSDKGIQSDLEQDQGIIRYGKSEAYLITSRDQDGSKDGHGGNTTSTEAGIAAKGLTTSSLSTPYVCGSRKDLDTL